MNKIISFAGEIGSGKTYFTMKEAQKYKTNGKSVLLISWADPIKQFLEANFGLTKSKPDTPVEFGFDQTELISKFYYGIVNYAQRGDCEINLTDHSRLNRRLLTYRHELMDMFDNFDSNYTKNYRRLIQLVGTEFGRGFNSNIWVNLVIKRITTSFFQSLAQVAIIDDTRFSNEFEALLNSNNFAPNIDVSIFGIISDIETRAKRTGMTVEELEKFSHHDSENFVPTIISNLSKNNIIKN